ncbi:hypothetical protein HYPBUDRAFT_89170, partial [Hyphopichia burtonii NRRL Y-1933]
YTINLIKRSNGCISRKELQKMNMYLLLYKNVKEINEFITLHAGILMKEPRLNVQLWPIGVQGVSTRLRVRISRKRKE